MSIIENITYLSEKLDQEMHLLGCRVHVRVSDPQQVMSIVRNVYDTMQAQQRLLYALVQHAKNNAKCLDE